MKDRTALILGAIIFVAIPLFISIFEGVKFISIVSVIFYFVCLACYYVKKSEEREVLLNDSSLKNITRSYIQSCGEMNGIPPINTHINLAENETAYYQSSAQLHETKSVRTHTTGMVGYRLTKRVFIGGARGKSESTEKWAHVDTGTLVVTDNRLIFDGEKTQRVVPLKDIISVEEGPDGLWVSSEKRAKTMLLPVENPYVCGFVIRVLAGFSVVDLLNSIGMQATVVPDEHIEEKTTQYPTAGLRSDQEATIENDADIIKQDTNDFSEISGVGIKSAQLIKAAGVNTLAKLAQKKPVEFREVLVRINSEKKIISGNPSLKEVTRWINVANEVLQQ